MVVAHAPRNLTTLYSFCSQPNCIDGAEPLSGLVQGTDGNLYGTTVGGGANSVPYCYSFGPGGCGTVFKITIQGILTTLYSFCADTASCSDGAGPIAGLVQGSDGDFYGTTVGGLNGQGSVFKITDQGSLTTLFTFGGTARGSDGINPSAPLVQGTNGIFYGTTQNGGPRYTYGTVFSISAGGALNVLYDFCGFYCSWADGTHPYGGLVQGKDGYFYGTTPTGGPGIYYGTVFKISPDGVFTTLHSFNGFDGDNPTGALIQGTDGNFYGTTSAGSTIFKITPDGTLTTLYTFCTQPNCIDGVQPHGGLLQATDGKFYGTTTSGGVNGFGTVFRLGGGNGIDLSWSSCGSTPDWNRMRKDGVRFVVVGSWGGVTRNSCATEQLQGAQSNDLATAAYAILNFRADALGGADQANNAIANILPAIGGVKFVAIDVETIDTIGESFNSWKKNHRYAVGNTIADRSQNGTQHVQKAVQAGLSCADEPMSWNHAGGTTPDCGVVWQDTGVLVLDQSNRIRSIRAAVQYVQDYGLKPILYTNRDDWFVITNNCSNKAKNNCSDLMGLKLWDTESGSRFKLNGKRHCGDGIAGLTPFKAYPCDGLDGTCGKSV